MTLKTTLSLIAALTFLSFDCAHAQTSQSTANTEDKKEAASAGVQDSVDVTLKIYRWSFANSISMPDFGTGNISSRNTKENDPDLYYKSDGKWHHLRIAPRQMLTIQYKGPKTMIVGYPKAEKANSDPNSDLNYSVSGKLEIPVSSGEIFALMIKSGSSSKFYPMNVSPKELPKNKFAVLNMTKQSVAFNINGQTNVIGSGRSFIFSPKKGKDSNGITCQIAKWVKGKWIPCYKNIISIPDDTRTMLLVYDPATKSAPRYNVQVLNLR